MARCLLLLALLVSCGNTLDVSRYSLGSSKSSPYGLAGSHITFPNIHVAEDDTLKCRISFGSSGIAPVFVEPFVTHNRTSAICRLPPEIKPGRVEVDLEINKKGSVNLEIHSGTFFVDPSPILELEVEENWQSNQVVFKWNAEYFKCFYDPGSPIFLQATLMVSDGPTPNFQPVDGVLILVGLNDLGTIPAPVSDAAKAIISEFRYPYFYILRPMATDTDDIYQSSGLLTPTLAVDEVIAKDVCTKWINDADDPDTSITPCPPCLCKAKLDPNFEPTTYPPQIVQLANGRLDNHVLYYEKKAEGEAQTCSYNVANEALALLSPAQAGWLHHKSKHMSYVDNYFSDIWPYIACCLQTNSDEFCQAFHEKRPVDDGLTYPGPDDPCSGTGDPHMTTFDGVRYDFMGWGEFWLIRGPSQSGFGVQGRMSPVNTGQRVSFYRAVAMRDGNTTVQIDHKGSTLRLLVDGEEVAIPSGGLRLPHKSLFITVAGNQVEVRAQTGFTIKVDSYPSAQTFNTYGFGAKKNRGKGFMGIYGNFDGNRTNDLTSQDGFNIEPTAENLRNLSLIHNVFGLSWMTTAEESYFTYENGLSWDNYTNVNFGPYFEYPNPEDMSEEVRRICGTSLACYYEYVGTDGDLGEAGNVKDQEDEFDELKEEIEKKIPFCNQTLAPPEHGRVDFEGYMNGSAAIYSCDEEYDFVGGTNARKVCIADDDSAEWVGEEPICIWTCTKCLQDAEFVLSHDPNDCTKFFMCASGVRTGLDCPSGQVFYREAGVCGADFDCVEGC